MKIPTRLPSRLQWTVQDLVDAVPLRLSETIAFAAIPGARSDNDSRFDRPSRRELRGRYLPERASLPLSWMRN